jgi:ribose transport system substrate-binding protein
VNESAITSDAVRRHRRIFATAVTAVVAAVTLTLAGCSSGGDFSGGSNPSASTSASAVSSLPKPLQAAYVNLNQPVGPTAYEGAWKPRGKAPWTIGYASPYTGNAWQAAAKDRLFQDLLAKYQKAGIIKNVVITESNLDDTVQNQQIRQLVDQGADLIYTCCSNTTSLNQSIQYAHSKGVPFVSFSGYVNSPYAVNTSANYHQAGFEQGTAVFKKIGGTGTVLDVVGNPGAASSDSFDAGVKEASSKYPNVKLVGQVAGQWAGSVTKAEVQKYLATNSAAINGIVVQPGEATGALDALKESGRPIVPISLGGESGAMCYWVNHPDFADSAFNIWPPGDEMQFGFEVAVRTLEGQGPKIQSIVRNVSPITIETAKAKLGANCNESADSYIEPSADEWMSTATLNGFFEHPADPLTYKP